MPYLALVFCTLIWGATFPATKVALTQVQPFTFLLLRFLLGTLLVFGVMLALRGQLRAERQVLRMSVIATGFLFMGYATQTVGLRYTTASNSAFITALYVVFVPLVLRRFDGRTWLSAFIALSGLWFLVDPLVSVNPGDLWTLACAAAFAGHIACLEKFSRRGASPSILAWQMLFMTSVLVPAMALEAPNAAELAPTSNLLIALLICGVLATGALAAQIWGQKFVAAQRVALIFILEPVFAAWMAWMVLGEQLGPRGVLGSGLILVAVLLGSVTRTEARVEAASHTPVPG